MSRNIENETENEVFESLQRGPGRIWGNHEGIEGSERNCRNLCPEIPIVRTLHLQSVNQFNRLIPNVDQFFPFSRNNSCERVIAVQYGNQVRNLDCLPVVFAGALGTYRCTKQGIYVDPISTQPLDAIDVIVCWVCSNDFVRPCLACFGYQSL